MKWVVVVAGLAWLTPHAGWSGEVCPSQAFDGDLAVWSTYTLDEELRADYSDYYGIYKDDWDGGWGWNAYDPATPFGKMMNSVRMVGGISTAPMGWRVASVTRTGVQPPLFDLTGVNAPSAPLLSLNGSPVAADVFLVDRQGHLIHLSYRPGEIKETYMPDDFIAQNGPVRRLLEATSEDVTLSVGSAQDLRLAGRLVQLSAPGAPFRILGLGRRIVLFTQGASGWSGQLLSPQTSDPKNPELIGNPAVLQSADGSQLDLIGPNGAGRLVHYRKLTGQPVTRTLLPVDGDDWLVSPTTTPVAAAYANGDTSRLEVYARRHRDGAVLHFQQTAGSGTWSVESLSEVAAVLDPATTYGQPFTAKTLRDGAQVLLLEQSIPYRQSSVLGVDSRGNLLRFHREQPWGGPSVWSPWTLEDLSQRARHWPEMVGLQPGLKIAGEPAAVVDAERRESVFGRGLDPDSGAPRGLGYFSQDLTVPGFPMTENGWLQFAIGPDLLRAAPVLVSSGLGEAIDPISGEVGLHATLAALALDASGRLVSYRRLPGFPEDSPPHQDAWVREVPGQSPASPPQGLIGAPAAAYDFQGRLHVVAIASDRRSLVHFQTSLDRPWHASIDYARWASGWEHDYHFEPKCTDGSIDDPWAEANSGFSVADTITMHCSSFSVRATSAIRLALMLHEAAHIFCGNWFSEGGDEDLWVEHGADEIPFGSLDPDSHEHGPNQIEVEYLADLAEFASGWVPLSERREAQVWANSTLSNELGDTAPAWRVGEPRPF